MRIVVSTVLFSIFVCVERTMAQLPESSGSQTCELTDYVRASGPCQDGKREINFEKANRNCTDPFQFENIRKEPCACTPSDYEKEYSKGDDGKCYLQYRPSSECSSSFKRTVPHCFPPHRIPPSLHPPRTASPPHCIPPALHPPLTAFPPHWFHSHFSPHLFPLTASPPFPPSLLPPLPPNTATTDCQGGQESKRIPVDLLFCELKPVPCTEANVKSMYLTCDYIRDPATDQQLSKTRMIQVVYYFDNLCNPAARGSLALPPSDYIPCGYYSMGGGFRYDAFKDLDPKVFQTECSFSNNTGTFPCEGWYAEEGQLKVGSYDPANYWLEEECAYFTNTTCHNNLQSALKLPLTLVRDGYVTFRFTVSSERQRDGLVFYIDDLTTPAMLLAYNQFDSKEVGFPLAAGRHTLVWAYIKDSSFTQGRDSAALQFLEVDGIAFTDSTCLKCPAGFFRSCLLLHSLSELLHAHVPAAAAALSALHFPSPHSSHHAILSSVGSKPPTAQHALPTTSQRTLTSLPLPSSPFLLYPRSPPIRPLSVSSLPSVIFLLSRPPPQSPISLGSLLSPLPLVLFSLLFPSFSSLSSSPRFLLSPRPLLIVAHCTPRPLCNVTQDATPTFTPCVASSRSRTRVWSWLAPQVCQPDPAHGLPPNTTEPCGNRLLSSVSTVWILPDSAWLAVMPVAPLTPVTPVMQVIFEAPQKSPLAKHHDVSLPPCVHLLLSLPLFLPPSLSPSLPLSLPLSLPPSLSPSLSLSLPLPPPPLCVQSRARQGSTQLWIQPLTLSPAPSAPLYSITSPILSFSASAHPSMPALTLCLHPLSPFEALAAILCPPSAADHLARHAPLIVPGEVAVKMLLLEHFRTVEDGKLPSGFQTGCSGECGSGGWRVVGDHLDSGANNGKTASVWLALTVNLTIPGYITYDFDVDIPPGDLQRGLFFYVDDNLLENIEDGGSVGVSVPVGRSSSQHWPLAAGSHRIMWVWVTLNADRASVDRSSAILHSVRVWGAAQGGAPGCVRIPAGAQKGQSGDAWEECPAGYYSEGGQGLCQKCPANTFNPKPAGNRTACEPCGLGTTSLEGSAECSIGDVTSPSSFCTFIVRSFNSTDTLLYDLSPLAHQNLGRLVGPIYEGPSFVDLQKGPKYYVSVCARSNSDNAVYRPVASSAAVGGAAGGGAAGGGGVWSGDSSGGKGGRGGKGERENTTYPCIMYTGKPLNNTYVCRINPNLNEHSTATSAHSLGDTVSLAPLGSFSEPQLQRRGLVMSFNGESCPMSDAPSTFNLTFICDPEAGYGHPEPWTEGGKKTALDPTLSYPAWANRSGDVIPVGREAPVSCLFQMVWYTAYACPLCTVLDMEPVAVANCIDNKRFTYKYKTPTLCQPNPQVPLPPDEYCLPCTKDDYQRFEDSCTDANGVHNVTYIWKLPKTCNEDLPGAEKLPEGTLAGICDMEVKYIASSTLSPKYIAIFALGALAIVGLAVMTIMTWLKSRKIYKEYARLCENVEQAEENEMEEMDGGDEEDENEHEEAHFRRQGDESS
ncbi:unnamed protein product [Closterium sp. NIES-54]